MSEFTKSIPEEGDTVKVINTDSNSVFAKGAIKTVVRYEDKKEDAVYFELYKEPDNKVMFKKGYWEGTMYSWVRLSNYGGPEVEEDTDCWDYEIID